MFLVESAIQLTSAEILDIVANGYVVPFVNGELPPPAFVENNKSALENSEFFLSELLRLERIGAISRIFYRPRITLPCSVVYSNKWRLVCDASCQINPFVSRLSLLGGTVFPTWRLHV